MMTTSPTSKVPENTAKVTGLNLRPLPRWATMQRWHHLFCHLRRLRSVRCAVNRGVSNIFLPAHWVPARSTPGIFRPTPYACISSHPLPRNYLTVSEPTGEGVKRDQRLPRWMATNSELCKGHCTIVDFTRRTFPWPPSGTSCSYRVLPRSLCH